MTTPGAILNISAAAGRNHFDVQVAPAGEPAIAVHSMAEIQAGYNEPPEFTPTADGTAVRMQAEVGAATTSGSATSRCELREQDEAGNNMAFDSATGLHYIQGRTVITDLPPVDPEIVWAQLHDGSSDGASMRTQLVSGTIRARVRVGGTSVTNPQIMNPYVIGTPINWRLELDNSQLNFYWSLNDDPLPATPNHTAPYSSASTLHYFKAGMYNQSSTDAGTAIGGVELSRLEHWHTGWATPVPADPAGPAMSAALLSFFPDRVVSI